MNNEFAWLRQLYAKDLANGPRQHSLLTAECLPLRKLADPNREHWTEQERAHTRSCEYCQRMVAISWRANGCPHWSALQDYVQGNYADAGALEFHLRHDMCERCQRWLNLAEALGRVGELVRQSLRNQAPLLASHGERILSEGAIPGGSDLYQRTIRDEEGNIRIRVSSGELAFEGVEVEVVLVEKEHPSLTLRRKGAELICGEVVIPADREPDNLERLEFRLRSPKSK